MSSSDDRTRGSVPRNGSDCGTGCRTLRPSVSVLLLLGLLLLLLSLRLLLGLRLLPGPASPVVVFALTLGAPSHSSLRVQSQAT